MESDTPTFQDVRRALIVGLLLGTMFVLAVLALTGCALRTIYVPYGEPVRLRAKISNAQVWVADKQGKEVPGTMDLPEGWYCLPDTRK